MNREEVIARIKEHMVIHKSEEPRAIHITEALEMAIKALEQEPCEDCVSRKAVFETIDDCNSDGLTGIFCSYDDGERFKKYIKELPSLKPTRKKGGVG